VSIKIRCWQDGKLEESTDVDDLARLVARKDSATWIDLGAPSAELLHAVARRLGLHPLIAEDIVERNERAKVRMVGDVIHIVLFELERQDHIAIQEVDFVLGHDFILSVHSTAWDPMAARQVKGGVEPLLSKGPDLLLWALIDSIVDGYFPVFDKLGDEIDEVEDLSISQTVPSTLQRIFRLKKELLQIRHYVAPSREVVAQLTSREFEVIREPNIFYFRDVYDHLIRLNDELDSFRELVAGALEVYLSSINNNLSTIMKRLTGVTVILAGIGAIGGLFGMSEAATALAGGEGTGFYVILIGTIMAAIVSVFFLRRIDWI
jgi:magnesium transporter